MMLFMKKNKKIYGLLIILFVNVLSVYSQQVTEYNSTINSVFQYVDKSRISTGLLYDCGLQIVDPVHYNGTLLTDSNYVDIDIYKMLYWGMCSSKVNNNVSLQTPDQINQSIDESSDNSVAIMHIKYDKFKDDAVSLGLVTVQNEQIHDVNGKNPYEQRMLFAVSPKKKYYIGKTVSFKFTSNLFVNNTGKSVSSLQISFNNGSTYQTANWNTSINYTFSSIGIKDIYFKINYTDNTSYISRAKISVTSDPSVTLRAAANDSLYITATSEHSGGKVQIRYAQNNTTNTIKKPLIVAEGFDPGSIIGGDNLDIGDFITINQIGSINIGSPNILNQIDLLNYDIVYLDYNNGVDDIKRNAKLFRMVIEYVNAHKVGGNPNIVMGISMGGLVARYALRKMETENIEHDTWKYISVDTPHKGANIPIGSQAMLRHLSDINFSIAFINVFSVGNMEQIKNARNLLDSKAAKQMLIYYVNQNNQINNTEHTTFQAEYDNLGFPQRCENIAITNGAGNGTLNFDAGTQIIDYSGNYKFGLWVDILLAAFGDISGGLWSLMGFTNYPQLITMTIPGSSNVISNMKVYAAPNRASTPVYSGALYIKKKILWIININISLSSRSLNSNTNIYPVDGAPGGIYDLSIITNSLPADMVKVDKFTFIPTVSALGLSDWQSKLTSNLSTGSITTTFVRRFMPNSNEVHTFFANGASFLVNEISATPSAATIIGTMNVTSNRLYNRNIVVKSGGTLNVNNATLGANKITVESGGTINLSNNGKIECKGLDVANSGIINTPDGCIVDIIAN
jgi:hypothetical protein